MSEEPLRRPMKAGSDGGASGRAAGASSKTEGASVLYLCPECGGIVSGDDVACGKCGAKLALETDDLDGFLEGNDTRQCPVCAETIPSSAAVCPECHATLRSEFAGVEATTLLCEGCGATILQDSDICDSCGRPIRVTSAKPAAPGEHASPTPAEEEEMEGITQLIEEGEPEAEQVAAGLESLANEMEAEEAVLDLAEDEPPVKQARPAADVHVMRVAPSRRRRRQTVDWLRQTAAIATVAALAPAAYVAVFASEAGSWAVLAVFGSLQATALAVSFLDFAPIRGRWREHAVTFLGGLLILAVPVHNAMRVVLPSAADGALLVLGTTLAVAGSGPLRSSPAVYAPWLASLPGLVIASAAMSVHAPAGSPSIAVGTWAALAITAGSSVLLDVRRRWFDARVSESVRKAQDLAVGRNYRGAIEELDRAIELAGDRGPEAPWYSKGAALVVLGRYEEALACIETALRINPGNEFAWVNKGNALVRMGRVVDALKCYNSAIKVNPQYEVGWNNKGNALARLGKFDDALRCYEMALEVNGSYKGAWVNKGYVLTKLGDFEAAAKCADEVIRLGGPAGVGA